RLLDSLGGRVIDGKKVRAEALGRTAVFRGRTVSGDFVFEVPQEIATSRFLIEADGAADTVRFHLRDSGIPLLVVDAVSGRGVDTPVIALPGGTSISGDDKGRVVLPAIIYSGSFTVDARGYRPLRVSAELLSRPDADPLVRLQPVLNGLLLGRRISIDPSGGGSDEYGIGPDRLRGSTVNMELAKRIGSILSAAGASVGFTRRGEETVSVYERIDRVNRFAPEIALGLRLGSPSMTDEGLFAFRHYPGSRNGARAAEELSLTVCTLPPCTSPVVEESAALFLQQTSCPACEIHAPLVEFTEALFRNPSWLDLEASLIVKGLTGFFSDDLPPCGPQELEILPDGVPVPGVLVSLDGIFSALTDERGIARFECFDPGMHLLTVSLPGGGDFVEELEIEPGSTGIHTIVIDPRSP
ncbi:MAG TPA: N-acetylmuramoyl-L-alanine amidase, partial [Candidatus Krumholzibacterium sp.]|nr:N-acetylmuramoyl-L-alanine amidase [Candidatus Krumholzibacterium sp.]